MKYGVVIEGQIHRGDSESNEQVVEAIDKVMDELVELGIGDPTINLNLETDEVDVTVSVDAVNPFLAVTYAHGAVRTVFHAAGVNTPDWPGADELAVVVNRLTVEHDDEPEVEDVPDVEGMTASDLVDA